MAFGLQAGTLVWMGVTLVLLGIVAVLAWRLYRLGERRPDRKDQGPYISVTIGNPLELAESHARWGAQLGMMAPRIVTNRVYDTVCRELDAELAGRGVDARVRVNR